MSRPVGTESKTYVRVDEHGAITYILAHQEEVRQYLTRQGAIWDRWRAKSEERAAPVVARLRESASAAVPEQR